MPNENKCCIYFPTHVSLSCSYFDDLNPETRRLSINTYKNLNKFKCGNILCDVEILCDDGVEIPAHKVVLSGKPLHIFR